MCHSSCQNFLVVRVGVAARAVAAVVSKPARGCLQRLEATDSASENCIPSHWTIAHFLAGSW